MCMEKILELLFHVYMQGLTQKERVGIDDEKVL